jgi:hypothetical protein
MSKLSKRDEALLKAFKKRKLTTREIDNVLKGLKSVNIHKYNRVKIDFPDKHVRFGVFSDAHIGHKDYRPDVLHKMIIDGRRFGVEFWLNAGDTIEGMSGREGHIYELDYIGATEQLKYFANQFSQFRTTVYSIEAQNSHGGWFNSKNNAGLKIGEELEKISKHYTFIGYDEQDMKLANGLKIRLRHSGGGTAYAISYRLQKYVESITGGYKPHLLCNGHNHKSMYFLYRNVHCIEGGCLCDQTPFMKKIGTPAMVGYWLIDINMHKAKAKGVERINQTFVPFY